MAADHQSDVCFGADDAQALVSGGLHPERVEKLLRHAAHCDACRERLIRSGFTPPEAGGQAQAGAPAGAENTARASPERAPTAATIHRATTVDAAAQGAAALPAEGLGPACGHTASPPDDTAPFAPAASAPAGSQAASLAATLAASPIEGGAATGASDAGNRPYPFLEPPRGPDELGRLGEYRILRRLGEGGMGVVFEADDTLLGRRVAIKVLRHGDSDDTHNRRFLQEARLAASLPHDRIVTIYQVGQKPCPYIVMELLAGETLDARLKRERWLPLPEALRIAREVAEGLELAHEKRLVHRDIKPANVFLESARGGPPGGRVKVLDFGVARPIVSGERLTMQGHVVGTPAYMSPEQACGFSPDGRSDLFSLGSLLYAMLSGESPFQRDTDVDTLQAVVSQDPTPIREKLPQLPESVALMVGSLLSKSPLDRPRDARTVVDEIRRIERECAVAASAPALFRRRGKPKTPWSRKKKLGWSAASGLAMIVVAALVGLWSQWGEFMGGESSNSRPVPAADETASPARESPRPRAPDAAAASGVSPAKEAPAIGPAPSGPAPIKIGIVLSLSGVMRTSERPLLDAFLLAVEEVNSAGGLLGGRMIEPLWRDGQSRDAMFAAQAEDLIEHEKVATLFGCWRSPSRIAVEEVCRRHDNLLVYPLTYEGLEESPYVIYMGGAPNQQLLPAAKFAYAHLNKRKFFLVGAEGVYSYAAHEILKDEIQSLGAAVVGDEHVPLGSTLFVPVAEKIKATGADCVMSTVSGSGNFAFFHCLDAAGVDPASVPTISFRLTEEDLRALAQEHIIGAYAAWSYFQSGASETNRAFVARFRNRYGPERVVNDPMEAAYNGLHMWALAVQAAGSDRTADIRRAFVAQSYAAPEGALTISAENRHAARMALIGQVDESLEFDVAWNSPKPIPPDPFPPSRTKAQWQQWLRKLDVRDPAADNREAH